MPRVRVSTTVDETLLYRARAVNPGRNDATLIDAALGALLASHRAAEIDDAYGVYDRHPLDEPDDWGDLGSFGSAAGAT